MKQTELRDRTKALALRVIRMASVLPDRRDADIIARQVLRSATGAAANYREASRARSDAELIAKLGVVEQELDETLLWLELLAESGIVKKELLEDLLDETDQVLRMVITAIRTTKSRVP